MVTYARANKSASYLHQPDLTSPRMCVRHPPPRAMLYSWSGSLAVTAGGTRPARLGMPASIWWRYPSPEDPVRPPPVPRKATRRPVRENAVASSHDVAGVMKLHDAYTCLYTTRGTPSPDRPGSP